MVYVLTEKGQLSALDASTGSRSWEYTSPMPPAGAPLPFVAGDMVLLNLRDGSMDVLRADTGALLWRYRPHVPALAAFQQPLVDDGAVYVLTEDGHILALRESTGSPIWSIELHVSNALPFLFEMSGVIYVEMLNSSDVVALSASTGSILWHYQGEAEEAVTMTVTQNVIYLAFPGGAGLNMIGGITALRASDGSVLWRYSAPIPATQFVPVLNDSLVLIALQDGNVTALSASSGSVRWHRYVDS